MSDQLLADLAVAGLQGAIEGFRETAGLYGFGATLTLEQIIDTLEAVQREVAGRCDDAPESLRVAG